MATTLITGASSGLGTEFARIEARAGNNLVVVARSRDVLDQLAHELHDAHGVTITVLAHDLSDPTSVDRIVQELKERNIRIDTLINNAGVGKLAPYVTVEPRDIRDMVELNVMALALLARALLPGMIERKSGAILNVASTAAFAPGPLMATYYATKAFVLHWSVALRNELLGSGVTVTCLCPGPTRTGFQRAASMLESPLFKRGNTMAATAVAAAGIRGLRRNAAVVVPGFMNKLMTTLTRFAPKTLVARVARMAQEQR